MQKLDASLMYRSLRRELLKATALHRHARRHPGIVGDHHQSHLVTTQRQLGGPNLISGFCSHHHGSSEYRSGSWVSSDGRESVVPGFSFDLQARRWGLPSFIAISATRSPKPALIGACKPIIGAISTAASGSAITLASARQTRWPPIECPIATCGAGVAATHSCQNAP